MKETNGAQESPWWRNASVYQVYLRSYKDSDGDGNGDLNGLRSELMHIAELGCDAIWLNPIYRSPQRDHGYDIADYRDIDPMYGALEDFDALVADAHRLGLRIIMDIVPNHCSDRHPWFQHALAAESGSPERERFLFVGADGEKGDEPPNSWQSVFGGSAWSRAERADGSRCWYLHTFDSSQPDFNWRNPEVRREFHDVLRWWFDRGVDGFRIDVAHGLVKTSPLPIDEGELGEDGLWDQPEVHEIYRSWRGVAREYEEEKYLVGEVWVGDSRAFGRYVAEDELHQAFAFDLLVQPWIARRLRAAIDKGLMEASPQNGPAWTLSNHDVHRAVTRYGQEQFDEDPEPSDMLASARHTGPVDEALGTLRARAAFLLLAALPGTLYLYQGEELGLFEYLDLPAGRRQDPIWRRTRGEQLGRDGCRIPMPWNAHTATLGFGVEGEQSPWLPQPEGYAKLARDSQDKDPLSMLALYRRALHLRKERIAAIDGVRWLDAAEPELLAFDNGAFICVTNTGDEAIPLSVLNPVGTPLLRTAGGDVETIERNSTSWFERP